MLGTSTNHINFFCLLRCNLPWTEPWSYSSFCEAESSRGLRNSKSVWAVAAVTNIFLLRGHCVPCELFCGEKWCQKFLGSWCFCLVGCYVIHLSSVFCHCRYPLYSRRQRTEVQIKVVPHIPWVLRSRRTFFFSRVNFPWSFSPWFPWWFRFVHWQGLQQDSVIRAGLCVWPPLPWMSPALEMGFVLAAGGPVMLNPL